MRRRPQRSQIDIHNPIGFGQQARRLRRCLLAEVNRTRQQQQSLPTQSRSSSWSFCRFTCGFRTDSIPLRPQETQTENERSLANNDVDHSIPLSRLCAPVARALTATEQPRTPTRANADVPVHRIRQQRLAPGAAQMPTGFFVVDTLFLSCDPLFKMEAYSCLLAVGFVAFWAGVAQLVEHLICNQRVGGSSPFASSSFLQFGTLAVSSRL